MDEAFAANYYRTEDHHWWCVGRRDMILRLLKGTAGDVGILDVGCSGGALIRSLRENGHSCVTGIDIDPKAIEACRSRGVDAVHVADARDTDFQSRRFGVVVASDVLEHVHDEDEALAEWHRVLTPGGKLIVFVPAFAFLWSSHDSLNHHRRRYSRRHLVSALERNRFVVERVSYWNFAFFPPAGAARAVQRALSMEPVARARYQLVSSSASANRALAWLLRIENGVLSLGVDFPFGISLFAVAKKA
ncbi:MAG: class I SAM-dependent methyltransferase [Elusimicrobia bacterium]|nr:class I SAM-dependent methyltransferase [Elusimicrobiota bacterium]